MVKKILVIGLTERMGGVETFIYNTTRFSDKSKYVYDFLVHGTDHTVFQKEITDFYNNENHFYFVPSIKREPFKALKCLNDFFSKNAHKYDYVHLETGATTEILYVLPFVKKYNLRVITHSHNGNGYNPFLNKIFRPLLNMVSNKRLSCSQEASDWLFGTSVKKDNIKIINNGIDTSRFTFNELKRAEIRERFNIKKDTLVIGHIGRFSEQKNHEFIIDIFEQIQKIKSNSVLMLLGSGEKLSVIHDYVNTKNLQNKVIFCGIQFDTEDYYSAFDVFLMPSLYEGLPIVGIEAQCEGLPCYFSDQISHELAITDLANFISLNTSANSWARKIVELRNVDRMAYPARIDNAKFSINSTVAELERIYEK